MSFCRLVKDEEALKAFHFLKSSLNKNPLILDDLDLGGKKLNDVELKQLCALLQDSNCKVKKLRFVLRFCSYNKCKI